MKQTILFVPHPLKYDMFKISNLKILQTLQCGYMGMSKSHYLRRKMKARRILKNKFVL